MSQITTSSRATSTGHQAHQKLPVYIRVRSEVAKISPKISFMMPHARSSAYSPVSAALYLSDGSKNGAPDGRVPKLNGAAADAHVAAAAAVEDEADAFMFLCAPVSPPPVVLQFTVFHLRFPISDFRFE